MARHLTARFAWYNSFNGSDTVSNVSTYAFEYLPNPAQPANATPIGDLWVGKFPSHLVQIVGVSVSTAGPPYTVTVTTATAHFLVPFIVGGPPRRAAIYNVSMAQDNGVFQVYGVSSPTVFTFQLNTLYGNPTITGAELMGADFQIGGVRTGTASVFEGNRILNCTSANYQDTWNSRDQIRRNNYYRSVSQASYDNRDPSAVSKTTFMIPLVSLTNVMPASTVAIATTAQQHGFSSSTTHKTPMSSSPGLRGPMLPFTILPPTELQSHQ